MAQSNPTEGVPDFRLLRAWRWTAASSGWQLTPEGLLWLLAVVLLVGIGIYKNINLLSLLGYVLLAMLVLNALVVGRRLQRLKAQPARR